MTRSTYYETTELSELVRRGVVEASALLPTQGRINREAPAKVLIVDDERVIADTLAVILNANGFLAERVYCAEDALSHMALTEPDVLITDVIMPGMNGVDLAVMVRELCPACEIFLLSGNGSSLGIVEAARAQGREFTLLMKPIPPGELIERISAKEAHSLGN